jgi:FkbM family methyltransferase
MSFRKTFKRWLYGYCPGFSGRFPYFGIDVFFPPQSKSFFAACEQGIYEADVLMFLQKLARRGTYIFDVGANIGLMAIPVLKNCPDCTVISFEPSPSSLPYLRRTVFGSGFADRWIVVEKALADREGELDFTVGRPQDSLYEGFRSSGRLPDSRMVKVLVSTLNVEWARLGRPDVSIIKIDVEGAESLVLEGAADLLNTCRPYLVVEWYADHLKSFGVLAEELLNLAQRHKYRLHSIPNGVPVDDVPTLRAQMLVCWNFLLSP